jgi:hypothetical protein
LSSQKLWQQALPPHTRTSAPSSTVVVISHASCAGHSAGIGVHSAVTMPPSVLDSRSQPPARSAAQTKHKSRTQKVSTRARR